MEEVWKDVVGYEGYYEVSNLGNVRAVDRIITRIDGVSYKKCRKSMAKVLNDDGYPTVKLSKNGKSTRIAVHRLVAMAFVPNPDELPEVNHIDFDRTNVKADNLEWVSHKDNIYYTIQAGRHHCNWDLRGKNNPNYKNDTLKKYYLEHPEEREKLARHGAQNGRAVRVKLETEDGETIEFGFLRECAKYLIENGFCNSKNVNGISDRITRSIKDNSTYCNCHFSRV